MRLASAMTSPQPAKRAASARCRAPGHLDESPAVESLEGRARHRCTQRHRALRYALQAMADRTAGAGPAIARAVRPRSAGTRCTPACATLAWQPGQPTSDRQISGWEPTTPPNARATRPELRQLKAPGRCHALPRFALCMRACLLAATRSRQRTRRCIRTRCPRPAPMRRCLTSR
jgi:hypothetical protein